MCLVRLPDGGVGLGTPSLLKIEQRRDVSQETEPIRARVVFKKGHTSTPDYQNAGDSRISAWKHSLVDYECCIVGEIHVVLVGTEFPEA